MGKPPPASSLGCGQSAPSSPACSLRASCVVDRKRSGQWSAGGSCRFGRPHPHGESRRADSVLDARGRRRHRSDDVVFQITISEASAPAERGSALALGGLGWSVSHLSTPLIMGSSPIVTDSSPGSTWWAASPSLGRWSSRSRDAGRSRRPDQFSRRRRRSSRSRMPRSMPRKASSCWA